jgi:hypothetical protein
MKKTRLDLESLEVVSFSTAHDGAAEPGTVFGQQYSGQVTCGCACSQTNGVPCKSCGPSCYE